MYLVKLMYLVCSVYTDEHSCKKKGKKMWEGNTKIRQMITKFIKYI